MALSDRDPFPCSVETRSSLAVAARWAAQSVKLWQMESRSHRVLLDTNIWSRLGDYGYGRRLTDKAKDAGARVLVAPAILEEAACNPDVDSRKSIISLIADNRWRYGRLAPEPFGHADELVGVVRRLRPHWLRAVEGRQDTEFLKYCMTTVYRNAERDPQAVVDYLETRNRVHGDPAAVLNRRQLQERDPFRAKELLAAFPDILAKVQPPSPEISAEDLSPNVLTEMVRVADDRIEEEPWRWVPAWTYEASNVFWHNIFDPLANHSSLSDSIEPFIDLRALRADRISFYKMWWEEVAPADAPRIWMDWAVMFVQLGRTVRRSNSVDRGLACYLYDCDVFVTADAAFADVLDVVTRRAPQRTGVIRRVCVGPADQFWEELCLALRRPTALSPILGRITQGLTSPVPL